MNKIPFEDGTLVTAGYVTIEGQNYEVNEAIYEGNTPLSAFNLNKMQDNIENTLVKVSSTEPSPKSDIWFQHGKNMYDGQAIKNGLWNGVETVATNENGYYIVIPIVGGRTYTISRKNTSSVTGLSLGALTTADYPAKGVNVIDAWKAGENGNLLTMPTTVNAKYLFIGVAAGPSYTVTNDVKEKALVELQIEENSSKTSYEKYIEDKIFAKNLNNNYEEFNTSSKITAAMATISSNQSITTTSAYQITKLNLDSIISSGNLSLSGNAIKIGKGVNKILVSANTSFVEKTDGLVNLQFLKNSNTVGKTVQGMSDQARLNISAPPQLIEVSEGDLIYMCLAFGNTQTGKTVSSSSTFMTVQVIE